MAHKRGNIYEWRRIVGELFEEDKPYATMDDGPEDYLFRKDGKQKLVGSVDNDISNLPEDDVCPVCDGLGEIYVGDAMYVFPCKDCEGSGVLSPPQALEEDDTAGYRYRTETDYEEDNSKIWHYGKAPGEDWMVIDRSPYAPMDQVAWPLYVDFHKKNGRWPTQQESYRIEELEQELWDKQDNE